jgi:hypothetical protein
MLDDLGIFGDMLEFVVKFKGIKNFEVSACIPA